MIKIFDLALLKVKLTMKDKIAVPMMLIAPIIFIFILVIGFGSSNSNVTYPIGIVNNDKGKYSTELINMIKEDKTFQIFESNYDEAKERVQEGKTAMAIAIPEGYSEAIEHGEDVALEQIKLQDNESTIAIIASLGRYVTQAKIQARSASEVVEALASANIIKNGDEKLITEKTEKAFENKMKTPIISYTSEKLVKNNESKLKGMSTSAIGIIVMFIMFFVTGGAGAILEEKEFGTWNRILATPTRKLSTLGGFILGNFLLGWIQIAVLIAVSKNVFGISWGNSTFGLIILFSSFLLAIIALGAALASFVKTKAQLTALTSIIIVPSCMLAGCLWPKDIMPQFMIDIANFVPQTWVLNGMTNLIGRNAGISSVILPSGILIVFAAAFFTMGLTFMTLKEK